MLFEITITRSASKEIKRLPREVIRAVFQKIKSLESQPRPQGCKKLVGSEEDIWRIRIGDYRVLYTIDDVVRIVEIRKVDHRKDAYR